LNFRLKDVPKKSKLGLHSFAFCNCDSLKSTEMKVDSEIHVVVHVLETRNHLN